MSERTPQYPVGKFHAPESFSLEDRARCIETIASAPARMREAVAKLTAKQLDTPYREGGWTVRQVIHHIPESHMNAYIRFKLALTETNPVIKPYDEAAWARLSDVDRGARSGIAQTAGVSARTMGGADARTLRLTIGGSSTFIRSTARPAPSNIRWGCTPGMANTTSRMSGQFQSSERAVSRPSPGHPL